MGPVLENREIRAFLQGIHPVEDTLLDEYLNHWEVSVCSRKTLLTTAGQTQKHLLLVRDGIQKSYYLREGKQHVIAFTYAPGFSGIPESFITQTPSRYFLEAITPSRFLRLSYERHEHLMRTHRSIETLFRKAIEKVLTGMVERQYELMALDIETRFRTFVQRSPHLLNRVPHKDLASYMRMDPTNFSKLLGAVKT